MYGEVIDAIVQLVDVVQELDRDTRKLLREFGGYVSEHWSLPDAGIWEPRGGPEHRTHSRLMCWVALDRLLSLCRRGYVDRLDPDMLIAHRDAIRRDIEQHAWDARMQAYTTAFGNRELDASVLLMSWYGFHPAASTRMRSTYALIRERLGAGPGLLYRYEDSLRSGEGAFWICSFWAVEHLALGGGSLDGARALFESACRYANDLGLMAEEVEPSSGQPVGNFPQAYTHVGVINAALSIDERAQTLTRSARIVAAAQEARS